MKTIHRNQSEISVNQRSWNQQDVVKFNLRMLRDEFPINPFIVKAPTTSNTTRRWSHLFPRTTGTSDTAGELYMDEPNWRSVTEPACLPLTTEFIPPQYVLRSQYKSSVYNLTLLKDNKYQNKVDDLLHELVSQRLAQNFQSVTADILEMSQPSGSSSSSTMPSSVALLSNLFGQYSAPQPLSSKKVPKKSYHLALGTHVIFEIRQDVTNAFNIIVQRYVFPEAIPRFEPCHYLYDLWPTNHESFIHTHSKIEYNNAQMFNWNYVDNLICGQWEEGFADQMKYWRIQFALVPLEQSLSTGNLDCFQLHESDQEFSQDQLIKREERSVSSFQKFRETLLSTKQLQSQSLAFDVEIIRCFSEFKVDLPSSSVFESVPSLSSSVSLPLIPLSQSTASNLESWQFRYLLQLVGIMRRSTGHSDLAIRDQCLHGRIYRRVVSGLELCDWVRQNSGDEDPAFVRDPELLGQRLVDSKLLIGNLSIGVEAAVSMNRFSSSKNCLYRFAEDDLILEVAGIPKTENQRYVCLKVTEIENDSSLSIFQFIQHDISLEVLGVSSRTPQETLFNVKIDDLKYGMRLLNIPIAEEWQGKSPYELTRVQHQNLLKSVSVMKVEIPESLTTYFKHSTTFDLTGRQTWLCFHDNMDIDLRTFLSLFCCSSSVPIKLLVSVLRALLCGLGFAADKGPRLHPTSRYLDLEHVFLSGDVISLLLDQQAKTNANREDDDSDSDQKKDILMSEIEKCRIAVFGSLHQSIGHDLKNNTLVGKDGESQLLPPFSWSIGMIALSLVCYPQPNPLDLLPFERQESFLVVSLLQPLIQQKVEMFFSSVLSDESISFKESDGKAPITLPVSAIADRFVLIILGLLNPSPDERMSIPQALSLIKEILSVSTEPLPLQEMSLDREEWMEMEMIKDIQAKIVTISEDPSCFSNQGESEQTNNSTYIFDLICAVETRLSNSPSCSLLLERKRAFVGLCRLFRSHSRLWSCQLSADCIETVFGFLLAIGEFGEALTYGLKLLQSLPNKSADGQRQIQFIPVAIICLSVLLLLGPEQDFLTFFDNLQSISDDQVTDSQVAAATAKLPPKFDVLLLQSEASVVKKFDLATKTRGECALLQKILQVHLQKISEMKVRIHSLITKFEMEARVHSERAVMQIVEGSKQSDEEMPSALDSLSKSLEIRQINVRLEAQCQVESDMHLELLVAESLENIGLCLVKEKKYDAALDCQLRCLGIRKEAGSRRDGNAQKEETLSKQIIESMHNVGFCLASLGRFQESVKYLATSHFPTTVVSKSEHPSEIAVSFPSAREIPYKLQGLRHSSSVEKEATTRAKRKLSHPNGASLRQYFGRVKKEKIKIEMNKFSGDDRYQWIFLQFDSIFHPESCYHMEVQWMISTGSAVQGFVQRLQTIAKSSGLNLIQVPVQKSIKHHPFRSTTFIPTPVDGLIDRHKLLTRFNFMIDSRSEEDGNDLIYMHKTGVAFIIVVRDGFNWTYNYTSTLQPLMSEAAALLQNLKNFCGQCFSIVLKSRE